MRFLSPRWRLLVETSQNLRWGPLRMTCRSPAVTIMKEVIRATICTWVADPLRVNGRSSADEWQIICGWVAHRPRIIRRPNFSLTKCNLHISSSWNVNQNLRFQLEWNVLWKLEFQYPFQHTWNARFQMHLFLYQNSKFRFTISVHLFCNLTPGISATFQLVQNPILFL